MSSNTLVLVAGLVSVGILAGASASAPRDVVLYNHSHSVPPGFYIRESVRPRIGALVTVRARDVALSYATLRDFTDEGDRFIKHVIASQGDEVCAVEDVITVNNRTVAHRARRDAAGRLLPQWIGCRVLQDEVFLLGDTVDSFDGRYFGPVSTSLIEGVWRFLQ